MSRLPLLCFLLLSLSYCKKNKEAAAPENQGSLQLSEKLCSIEDFIDLAAEQQSSGTASESPPSETPLGLAESDGQTDGNTEQRRQLALSLVPYAQKVQEYRQKHGGLEGQEPENAQFFRLVDDISNKLIESPELFADYFASDAMDASMKLYAEESAALQSHSVKQGDMILKDKNGNPCRVIGIERNLQSDLKLTEEGNELSLEEQELIIAMGSLLGAGLFGAALFIYGFSRWKSLSSRYNREFFEGLDKDYKSHDVQVKRLLKFKKEEQMSLDAKKTGKLSDFEKAHLPEDHAIRKISTKMKRSIQALQENIKDKAISAEARGELEVDLQKLQNRLEFLRFKRMVVSEGLSKVEDHKIIEQAYANIVKDFENPTSMEEKLDSDRSAQSLRKTSEYMEYSVDDKVKAHTQMMAGIVYEEDSKKKKIGTAKNRFAAGAIVVTAALAGTTIWSLENHGVVNFHKLSGPANPYHAFLKHFEKITVERAKLGAQAN